MGFYAMLSPTGSIVDLTGYRLFADARFGSNGESIYTPEYNIGNSSSSSGGLREWDSDLSDGLDTGAVSVSMDANLQTGSGSFGVAGGGSGAASFSFASGGSIQSVKIIAGAQVPGQVTWSDLSVSFYHNGTLQDTVSISGTVGIDTTNSSTGIGEQICVVTPGASNDNRAVVTGKVRFQAGSDVYPGPDDLFGQIMIMPNP